MMINLYFSDFFEVSEDVIESYGAMNISLINDLPLFIDPFLLFNSQKDEYQEIHEQIIKYMRFLQEQAEQNPNLSSGMMKAWYLFGEVKQTWLGFSLSGNRGLGLGPDFAKSLHFGLNSIFSNFGRETITKSPHLEKLCLISPKVGRDKISDFTTHFAKKYLLEYTERFALQHLHSDQYASFAIPEVEFNYNTMRWIQGTYTLPFINGDYVLLTPKDLLTGEETFINRSDMLRNLRQIAPSIDDDALRFNLDTYFQAVLTKKRKELSKKEKDEAGLALIRSHPELIDYYIKHKEEHEEDATSISEQNVQEIAQLFIVQLQELVNLLAGKTAFYQTDRNSYEAAYRRVQFLKTVIEDMDGYRLFYVNGKAIKKESLLQGLYRLVWYGSEYDVNREPNNGRGPVDFKVSKGAEDSTLIEFKLASNSKLKHNLAKQVEIYKKANATDRAIKVILFFTDAERKKVIETLNELGILGCKDIILIDAIDDKISASNARINS